MASQSRKVSVSVLIPTKNEAINLSRCLASAAWADEIIVVDSQSTDGSLQIAERHGAKVVQFHFRGIWPKKKNWALENIAFRNEWVFILDADETLPIDAEEEVRNAIEQAGSIAGYWINRRFMFMGRWMRHAYYPNWNLRLFRHSLGRYEKLTVSQTNSGDNEVHEHVVVQGPTARLSCQLDHYPFPSIEVFVEKHNRYSNWEARVMVDNLLSRKSGEFLTMPVGRRRKLKLLSQRLPFRPLLRFLYVYIWQKGFLDGWEGYYFARLHAIYEFLSVAKAYELKKGMDAD